METLLKSLEHAPALVAMLALVMIFAKSLEKILATHAARTNEFIATMKELNTANLLAREHSRHVIEANTKAAAETAVAMNEMTNVMREFVRK